MYALTFGIGIEKLAVWTPEPPTTSSSDTSSEQVGAPSGAREKGSSGAPFQIELERPTCRNTGVGATGRPETSRVKVWPMRAPLFGAGKRRGVEPEPLQPGSNERQVALWMK